MNSQLTIALHILGFLTVRGGEPLTSEVLAGTYGTSPVVPRRVLAKLQRAGLIETRRGAGGGSVLARSPETINLRGAFDAIADGDNILPRHPAEGASGMASFVGAYVNELVEEAEHALVARLESVTVAEMDAVARSRLKRARGRSRKRC